MNRREELAAMIPADSMQLVEEVLDEIIFLESKLEELKRLPFVQVNPKNQMQQRNTPAAKLYKEFLQQYINCIKLIESVVYKDKRLEENEEQESPLRKWFNAHDSKNKRLS